MSKNNLSESDLCDKVIRPAIVDAEWHTLDQIYAQYPLRAGRVVVRGKTAKRDQATVLFADFVLFFKPNIPLAVVEAKKSRLSMSAGMQQAINYTELLEVPFCFTSNGDGFVFRDATLASRTIPHRHPRCPTAPSVRRPAPAPVHLPIHPSPSGRGADHRFARIALR
jgi:type I restriction enzyme R subunit